MGANIYFEAVVTRKNKLFHHHMIEFFNRLALNDQKYQTSGTIRGENYK